MKEKHIPVLLKESIKFLNPSGRKVYVDATLGGGGHTKAILDKCQGCKVIGIDQDEEALKETEENLKSYKDRLITVFDNFRNLKNILKDLGMEKVSGILVDLGPSNIQLQDPKRGFSFLSDGPLDMRMDSKQAFKASDIVNNWPQNSLVKILRDLGEERYALSITRQILKERERKPITTTLQLVDIIRKATPPKYRFSKRIHFATNTFRALRMVVNDELQALKEFLNILPEVLDKKGRVVIISFHSLEDRTVKNFFKNNTDKLKILTKKPIRPSEQEINANPKSRSAKLRVAQILITKY